LSIEKQFDLAFVAELALREKQIQQNYRPIIAVHKWFARRPGTLFRALLLSEFGTDPLPDAFYKANEFKGRSVADPFMGGGSPLIEANRLGCDVVGLDINPMAAWIVKEEIEHLDQSLYRKEADALIGALSSELGELYETDCPHYGDRGVPVKYFLWVKVMRCEDCGKDSDLFPGYLLAEDSRHPKNVVVCSACGDLNEVSDVKELGKCRTCRTPLVLTGPASRGKCNCSYCGKTNTYPSPQDGPPRHRMFAIEYHNPFRPDAHKGRFFKKPDESDLAKADKSRLLWQAMKARFVPTTEIPEGDESTRLHRWGYQHYRDLFNHRQLLGLESSCRLVDKVKDARIRRALATNLSDLLRYQNMLCRYDTMALKSLDIFSIHGFPVGLVQCESNLLGTVNGNGVNVGSGGWGNIIDKYAKAKRYCDEPFEVRHTAGRKVIVPISGEWIGERLNGTKRRSVRLLCEDSAKATFAPESLDAVLTDPPYFGNVQYAELMDFCYVWLRKLVGKREPGFELETTRSTDELTGNNTKSRGLVHFTEGIAAVFTRMAKALKPGAPLAFTFHHNQIEAYCAIGVAILDAGLVCSTSFPCPAEMSGSIHISGTGSSILDSVLVCRAPQFVRPNNLFASTAELLPIVSIEKAELVKANVKLSAGDARCMVFGHLMRMAVWQLHRRWESSSPAADKLAWFGEAVKRFGNPQRLIDSLARNAENDQKSHPMINNNRLSKTRDAVSI
jgi:putative DNA methylase